MALTESGEQLLQRVRPAVAELDAALNDLAAARDRPSGSIRISSTEAGASQLILHVLPGFLASYPDIHVEIIVDGRLVDIVAEGFDAGIRILEAVPLDMVAVRFGEDMRMIAVASPAYLAARRPPLAPHDLGEHRCIRFRFDSGSIYRWDLERRGKNVNMDVSGPMTVSSTRLCIQAALAGIGIAWVPEDQVVEHLESGRLKQLLAEWSPRFPGLCLYYPANRHPPPALRLFAKAVREWAAGKAQPRRASSG